MEYEQIMAMPPLELVDWLKANFLNALPQQIRDSQQIANAQSLSMRLGNDYSYLMTLLSYAKICVRNAKRSGDKFAYEDMVDRQAAIENFAAIIKTQFTMISRSFTMLEQEGRAFQMESGSFYRGGES